MNKSSFMNKNNNKGFTLIETIIYLGLLSLIIVFLVAFLTQATYVKGKINERLDNLDTAQYALERMTWYLQNSLEVNEPLIGQTSNQLVVNALTSDINPIKFFVQDKQLKMQVGEKAPINLTTSRLEVEGISFINQGFINQPPIIQIQLTIASKNSMWQTQPLTLQTAVKLEKK
jgi:type II secretory pathway pseudopilin PulG